MTAVRSLAAAVESSGPGAFAAAAEHHWRLGLFPLPLGGDDHREPLFKGFTKTRWRPGLKAILKLIQRYPNASIGIVTGVLSGLLVIDIENTDPWLLYEIERRFGEALFKVMTPRGRHLYYRYSGERCTNLRAEGLPVDIKAQGGYVVAPPSVRLTGENAGKGYRLAPGYSWADLARLRPINPGSLSRRREISNLPATERTKTSGAVVQLRAVGVCYRNDTLFRSAMRRAPGCGGEAALLEAGIEINSHFNPPLDRAEVEKTIRSAWRYEEEGNNWLGRASSRAGARLSAISALRAHPGGEDAAVLYPALEKRAHNACGKPWPASPKAMARWRVIPAWGANRRRYTRALAVLVKLGFLLVVHRGGRYVGDTRKFAFPAAMPRLVVSEKADTAPDVDLMRVVDALQTGSSIRKAADELGMAQTRIFRLKRRAVFMGLLKTVEAVGNDHAVPVPAHRRGVPLRGPSKKEEAYTPRAAAAPLLRAAAVSETGTGLSICNTSTWSSEQPRKNARAIGVKKTHLIFGGKAMESESTCRAYMTNSTGYRLCGKPALGDGGRCQKHVEADLGCLVNIPDGAGGHRLCDKPVGRDGDILSGACVMENGSGNPARRQMSRAEMRREF